jgi:quercetin dioxygenase-like cupin family protein
MREQKEANVTSTTPQAPVAPIALGPDQGEALWAFGTLISVKAASETTNGRVMVTENVGGRGAGSPLHVHHREDEWFYVLEGELTLWVGGQVIDAPAGSFVYAPREIPHTFTVSSDKARFMLVTEPAGLEGMLRALGEPAGSLTLPPPPSAPPDMERIMQVCADHGIEILGPSGIPA